MCSCSTSPIDLIIEPDVRNLMNNALRERHEREGEKNKCQVHFKNIDPRQIVCTCTCTDIINKYFDIRNR